MDTGPPNALQQFQSKWSRQLQYYLDRSSPHVWGRWGGLVLLALIYTARVWYLRGFYIVTYAIAIYNLNLLLGFLTPQIDPEAAEEGPELPTKADQEFKPFIRRLPEFKFWWSSTKSLLVAFLLTFFSVFDVPVFWPILLLYWFVLFFVTMKRQIMHMIKYRYLPFSLGKKKYGGRGGDRRPVKDAKEADVSQAPVPPTVAAGIAMPQPASTTNLRQLTQGTNGAAAQSTQQGVQQQGFTPGSYAAYPGSAGPGPMYAAQPGPYVQMGAPPAPATYPGQGMHPGATQAQATAGQPGKPMGMLPL